MTLAHKILHNSDSYVIFDNHFLQRSSQQIHNSGGLPQQGCRLTEKDNQTINIIGSRVKEIFCWGFRPVHTQTTRRQICSH